MADPSAQQGDTTRESAEAHPAPIRWFRDTAPYINLHRGAVFVILVPGEAAVADAPGAGYLRHLQQDVALLLSLGIRLVLVLGSRPQIDRRLAEAGMERRLHQGRRVTEAGAIQLLQEVVGAQRIELEALLSMGMPNSPLQGARLEVCGGNFITARPLGVVDGIDYQHTGCVRRIDAAAIHSRLQRGAVVLLSCLGYSPTGEVFNLASEDVALSSAQTLQADKLILLAGEEGLYDGSGKLLRQCVADAAPPTQVPEHQAPLLKTANEACQGGVPRCHIVSYRNPDALLTELFTTDGSGTLVSRRPYEQMRRAGIDDVGGILDLIAPLEASGVLATRSREALESEIDLFRLLERDGLIIACAALYPFAEHASGELACIVCHPDYRDNGRAQRLLDELEREALSQGLKTLFVLTTQTAHWFIEQGFREATLDALPPQRQALYNLQRNSKVFVRPVDASRSRRA